LFYVSHSNLVTKTKKKQNKRKKKQQKKKEKEKEKKRNRRTTGWRKIYVISIPISVIIVFVPGIAYSSWLALSHISILERIKEK